jgi:hypothetical protein
VVVGEDDGLELVEEPDEGLALHPDDASPLVQALQTYNALLALEPSETTQAIEKPAAPAKATVVASLLPPSYQRTRPPMPTAELKLRASMPLLNGCAKQSSLLPPLAGDVRASLQVIPSIRVREALPTGKRVVIPPLRVRPRGTPHAGTHTKVLPVVPRVDATARPSERRVQIPPRIDGPSERRVEIPPLATSEVSVTPEAKPTPESRPVDDVEPVPMFTLEVPSPQASERSIVISPSVSSSRRRRRVVLVASSIGAVGIALAVVVVGGRDDSGAAPTSAGPVVMPVTSVQTVAAQLPPPPVPPPTVAVASPTEAPQAVAEPSSSEIAESPAAKPIVTPRVRAVPTTVASESPEPKPAHVRRRHHHDAKPETIVAATCAAEPKHNRAAKSEDLDSPFPE